MTIQTAAAESEAIAEVREQLRADGEKTMAGAAWASAVRHGSAAAALADWRKWEGRSAYYPADADFTHDLTLLARLERGDESEVNAILAVAKGEGLTAWTIRRDHSRMLRARLAADCAAPAERAAA